MAADYGHSVAYLNEQNLLGNAFALTLKETISEDQLTVIDLLADVGVHLSHLTHPLSMTVDLKKLGIT